MHNLPCPLESVGIRDEFGESGDYEVVLAKHGLDAGSIINERALERKKRK